MAPPQSLEKGPSSRSSNSSSIQFTYLTLFPEIFSSFFETSLIQKAIERELISCQTLQIRDFSTDKHRTVDDTPYGGGSGMLLRADVLHRAWQKAVKTQQKEGVAKTVLLSPQGAVFTQKKAKDLLSCSHLILVCGHYEGVDERFIDLCVDEEISMGDYILMGGELPAMVLTETVARLLPGVVGSPESIYSESLENGLLKYPQYTRPPVYEGLEVPPILRSGNHEEIRRWRQEQSELRTQKKRPDLCPSQK